MFLEANSYVHRLVGKVYLVLGILWVTETAEKITLNDRNLLYIYKVLVYFSHTKSYIPDASPLDYLGKLFIYKLVLKHLGIHKMRAFLDNLTKE